MQNLKGTTAMALTERLKAEPVSHSRTLRPEMLRVVTSGDAGYAIPLGFMPLLREDGLETTRVQMRAYMEETADLLLNTVHCVFSAYAVPKLAFDRFEGSMDALNRAYMGKPEKDGSFIKWIETQTYHDVDTPRPVYEVAGIHALDALTEVNMDYVEAYDKVFEYRCRSRSEALWAAVQDDVTGDGKLHPAFFDNPQMSQIKASFDEQQHEGEIPLTVTNAMLPVKGIGFPTNTEDPSFTNGLMYEADGTSPTYLKYRQATETTAGNNKIAIRAENGIPAVFAQMAENGITVSAANIELAKETQAWALVRNQYSGIDDDELIDLLMAGVAVPSQYLAKPMLLGRQKVPFGMTQRYSTDADALQVSATRGVAGAEMTIRAPQMNTGAVIVFIAEIVPEQFWERSADHHFLASDETRRPDRLLDQLDPQAVEVVNNWEPDVKHTDPGGVFGYRPLNGNYLRNNFRLGGKFKKDDPLAAWDQNRNRVWASEPVDPTLSREFYLAEDLPKEIFLTTVEDSFEFSLACEGRISGLTYFGPMLREATDDYEAIVERVDQSRITQAVPVVEDQSDMPADPPADPPAAAPATPATPNEGKDE